MVKVGVIGDFNSEFESHPATGEAIRLAAKSLGMEACVEWLPTPEVSQARLRGYDALWASPGSPYRDFAGMLNAISYAREQRRPFLGT